MLSACPRIGFRCPKSLKTHPGTPTQTLIALSHEKVTKIRPNWIPTGSPNPQKIDKNLDLDPQVSNGLSPGNPGSPKWYPRVPKWIPRTPKWQIWAPKNVPAQQSASPASPQVLPVSPQVLRQNLTGAGGRGKSLRIRRAVLAQLYRRVGTRWKAPL